MDLTTTVKRSSAVLASLAAGGLLTLASPAAVHAAGHHGVRDSDHDGMPNRWELTPSTSTRTTPTPTPTPTATGSATWASSATAHGRTAADSDGDGMDDGDEVDDGCLSTDPTDADTDDDGVEDGMEDADGDGIDNAEDETEDNCDADEDLGMTRATTTPPQSSPSYVVR